MRNLRFLVALPILFTPTVMTAQPMDAQRPTVKPVRSYTTRFQLDEDPISEGRKWINGGKDGIDWYNVITKNGVAYGAVTQGDYTDPTALLAGKWGKDQKVKARVFSRNQTEKYYQEVEIRLRSTLSPHRCTGYELFWRCLKTHKAYVQIVRWNGKLGDWSSLKKHSGAQFGVKDGDVVEATIVWQRDQGIPQRRGGDIRHGQYLQRGQSGDRLQLRRRGEQWGLWIHVLRSGELRRVMARVYSMKHSHPPSSGTNEDPSVGFGYFIRYAAEQTAFGVVALLAVGLLLTAFFGIASVFTFYRFDPILIWKLIGFFLVLTVSVLWFCSICVGCLIMIPVEIWRLCHRRTQTDPKKGAAEEGLWDRYLDAPERP